VSYEEENACVSYEDTCVSYEEEDTCVTYRCREGTSPLEAHLHNLSPSVSSMGGFTLVPSG
jgi:hypothetical protein